MTFLIDNWMLLIVAAAVLAAAVLYAKKILQLPDEQLQNMIKHWLLWAVSEVEKNLGSGTGQLKLVTVYNMFIEKFPAASSVITFEEFSVMVDHALEEMKSMVESNVSIKSTLYPTV